MEKTVRRSIISGSMRAPPSIAVAHRALAASCLAVGQSVVSNLPPSPDLLATLAACRSFGADIVTDRAVADIMGPEKRRPPGSIDCGASNTTLKLFMPIASAFPSEISFSGTGALSKKPLEPFAGYLERLGAAAVTSSGFLPLKLRGPISERELVYLPGLGTQFLSGLLLACPLMEGDTSIGIEDHLANPEYVRATVELMKKCGIAFDSEEPDLIVVAGGQAYAPLEDFEIPGSRQLSSFILLAGAICGKVSVEGMPEYPELSALLESFGASANSGPGQFAASAGPLSGAELEANELGLLLPHALVLASLSSGKTTISGLHALRRHENSRMRFLARQLSRMGAKIEETGIELSIAGGSLSGAQLGCESDPAIGMALTAAALAAGGPSKISGAECIEKSYPGFFRDLSLLGAIIR
jgi:3-phosphoshikimate 1-carboxyvinyltransferase